MQRRQFSQAVAATLLGVAAPAIAHTPFNQWRVYRRKHLLIGCHKDAPPTYELAKSLTQTLEQHLPAASARVARAPHAYRIASLMATDQLDTAIVDLDLAQRIATGHGNFETYGKVAINRLFSFGSLQLIGLASMPPRHAGLIYHALAKEFPAPQHDTPSALAWHPGIHHAG